MTKPSSLSYPQYVSIEKGGKFAYLNGDKSLSFSLPKGWRNAQDLHASFVQACDKYGLDWTELSDKTITELIVEAISNLGRQSRLQRKLGEGNQKKDTSAPNEQIIPLTAELTREVNLDEISEVLDTSIKKDEPAKLIAFAGMLLAQTESDHLNIGFQSRSATGKSYIPIEVSAYFPPSEVVILASASPTAFYHEKGTWDEKRRALLVNLEGKILVFLDQPGFQLLERLRPLLSHDRKELEYKITDKLQKGGLRTKTVVIRGFASVYFCTTKQNPDEQEKTRLVLLSASTDQNKLTESLRLISLRKGNAPEYKRIVAGDPRRKWLTDRIKAVRQYGVIEVVIPNHEELVYSRFIEMHRYLKPRHQRDLLRVYGFIKFHAILNCFNREKMENGGCDQLPTIIAGKADIEAGFRLYKAIADSNERGLSPYIYEIFEKVIQPLIGNVGVTREAIQRKYHEVFHEPLSPETLKREVIQQLEMVGLIYQEPDPEDKRRSLIYPTHLTPDTSTTSAYLPPDISNSYESNRGKDSGVKADYSGPLADLVIVSAHGPRLRVLERTGEQLRCQCSVCGSVNPTPAPKDEKALSEWFERHISIFAKEHGAK